MPLLGLGTWDLRGRQCAEVVGWALDMGYRHIDTAWMYENQREVGEAIRSSGLSYDEIFLTSKPPGVDFHNYRALGRFTFGEV